MNPYLHAHIVMRRIHTDLLRWVRGLMLEAGIQSPQVTGRLSDEPAAGPQLVVMPYQLAPWPKMTETNNPLPLIGTKQDLSLQGIVPRAWTELGSLLTAAVQKAYPVRPAKGTHPARALPLTPLTQLPDALADWYRERGEDAGPDTWVTSVEGVPHGRLPSLHWQRPITVRARYLLLASSPPSADPEEVFGLPALAVVTLGLHLERTMQVKVPPAGCDDELVSYLRLMGNVLGGAEQVRMDQLIAQVTDEYHTSVAVLPIPDLETNDLAEVMRTLNRPQQPVVHLAVQAGIGARPELVPGVMPDFRHGRKGR